MKHGSVINAKNEDERTPLYEAVSAGNLKLVQYILENDSNGTLIKDTDRFVETPLHIASYMGFNDIVKTLLSYSKDTLESKYNRINSIH